MPAKKSRAKAPPAKAKAPAKAPAKKAPAARGKAAASGKQSQLK